MIEKQSVYIYTDGKEMIYMRIIHTSDWHLGKNLEGVSRIDEQEKFCNDFVSMVRDKNADAVIIAGDIYDTYNPSAEAEALFYETIEKLSDGGERFVYVIAGNHDNPERLESVIPLASKRGVTILGYPSSRAVEGKFRGFEILEAKEGFTKVEINGEVLNIIGIPYPSEKRLNEAILDFEDEKSMQKSYSAKVGDIFRNLQENFRDDEINIAVSHIFVVGSEITDSERRIELGGSLLVEKSDLPEKSQYTALGHIHKPQRMSKNFNAYYSGSPIQYSKSEKNTAKSVYIVDVKAGSEAVVTQEFVKNYRQIAVFKCDSIEEALEISRERGDEDIFAYFEIKATESLDPEDIRTIKKNMKYVLEIRPVISREADFEKKEVVDINRGNIGDYFIDFFKKNNGGIEPSNEILNIFRELISGEEEVN